MSSNSAIIHKNNFDFLRFLFAVFVLITHSYALSGLKEQDSLYLFSHGQAVLSHTGVQGFLIISGFLITKSLLRSESLFDYYYKRFLRVFPGLWATLLITILICYYFSNKDFFDYFSHYSPRDYFIFNAILKTQYYINDVFINNPYPKAINGSLWSIPYEVFFYIILSFCFFVRSYVNSLKFIFIGVYIILAGCFLIKGQLLNVYRIPFWELQGQYLFELGAFFLSGAIWAMLPSYSSRCRSQFAGGAILICVLSLYFGGYTYIQFLFLPMLVINFGMLNTRIFSWISTYGDFSYGIYLWGFFVQQTIVYLYRPNLIELMVFSIAITCILGAASWHLIEKQALRLKLIRHQVTNSE